MRFIWLTGPILGGVLAGSNDSDCNFGRDGGEGCLSFLEDVKTGPKKKFGGGRCVSNHVFPVDDVCVTNTKRLPHSYSIRFQERTLGVGVVLSSASTIIRPKEGEFAQLGGKFSITFIARHPCLPRDVDGSSFSDYRDLPPRRLE